MHVQMAGEGKVFLIKQACYRFVHQRCSLNETSRFHLGYETLHNTHTCMYVQPPPKQLNWARSNDKGQNGLKLHKLVTAAPAVYPDQSERFSAVPKRDSLAPPDPQPPTL